MEVGHPSSDMSNYHVTPFCRSALEKEALAYASEHFAAGVAAVYPSSYPTPQPVPSSSTDEPAESPPSTDPNQVPIEDAVELKSTANELATDEDAPTVTEDTVMANEDEPLPIEAEARPAPENSEAPQPESTEDAVTVEPVSPHHFTVAVVGNKYNPSNFWYACSQSNARDSSNQLSTGPEGGEGRMKLIMKRAQWKA